LKEAVGRRTVRGSQTAYCDADKLSAEEWGQRIPIGIAEEEAACRKCCSEEIGFHELGDSFHSLAENGPSAGDSLYGIGSDCFCQGEQFPADAVPSEPSVQVAPVLAPLESAELGVGVQLLLAQKQKRADEPTAREEFSLWRDAGQTFQTRSSEQVEEDGLGIVIGCVGKRNVGSSELAGTTDKEVIPQRARSCLNTTTMLPGILTDW